MPQRSSARQPLSSHGALGAQLRIKAKSGNARLEREAKSIHMEKLTRCYTLLEASLEPKCEHMIETVRAECDMGSPMYGGKYPEHYRSFCPKRQ